MYNNTDQPSLSYPTSGVHLLVFASEHGRQTIRSIVLRRNEDLK